MKKLQKIYNTHRRAIEDRLESFRKKGASSEKEIFAELCFCILTPQNRALAADEAIKRLTRSGRLFTADACGIRKDLKGVRFPNNKAGYIVRTRDNFTCAGEIKVKRFLKEKDVFKLREELVREVVGYGLKEASHFLRNIGRGSQIAILDRHVLKELKEYGIINNIPAAINEKKYLRIEKKLKDFAEKASIPPDALDLVMWYNETGYFFK